MAITQETFERVALEDPDGKWELHCGRLRSKPEMTTVHSQYGRILGFRLQQQISLEDHEVSVDAAYVRVSSAQSCIPDVAVVPKRLIDRRKQEEPTRLEVYSDPLPLIVEVWSPSTGEEDLTEKVPGYRQRGDTEVWLLHPLERTLRAWVWQPDGTSTEHVYRGGTVRPAALPNVAIDLDELFRL